MKTGVIGSLKFKRLKRLLQLPDYAVAGVLESIWCLAVDQAKFGDVGRFADEEIAAAIEWEGDAQTLINALVESRWLDRSPAAGVRLVVHDWIDHAPQFVTRWIARQLENPTDLRSAWLVKVALTAIGGYSNPTPRLAVTSQTGVDDPPYARQSNQTKPNQTKPGNPPNPPPGEPPKPKRSKIENLAMALPPLAEFPEPIRFDRCRMAWQSWLAYKAKNKPYRTVEGHRKQLAEAGAKGPESFLGAIALALRKEWQGPNLRAFLEMRAEGKINADGSENLEVFSGGNKQRSGGDRLGPGQRFSGEPAAEVASVRGW